MRNNKGKGWRNETRRHSEAATRGSIGRRKAAAKQKAAAKKAAKRAGSESVKELKRRDLALTVGGATVEANQPGTGSKVAKAQRKE